MFEMRNIDDLWEHIAYVLAYAPDEFPYEDFLPEDQQMNLDTAFEQLREGVLLAYPEDEFLEKREQLFNLLEHALTAYRGKDVDRACDFINEFQASIFKAD